MGGAGRSVVLRLPPVFFAHVVVADIIFLLFKHEAVFRRGASHAIPFAVSQVVFHRRQVIIIPMGYQLRSFAQTNPLSQEAKSSALVDLYFMFLGHTDIGIKFRDPKEKQYGWSFKSFECKVLTEQIGSIEKWQKHKLALEHKLKIKGRSKKKVLKKICRLYIEVSQALMDSPLQKYQSVKQWCSELRNLIKLGFGKKKDSSLKSAEKKQSSQQQQIFPNQQKKESRKFDTQQYQIQKNKEEEQSEGSDFDEKAINEGEDLYPEKFFGLFKVVKIKHKGSNFEKGVLSINQIGEQRLYHFQTKCDEGSLEHLLALDKGFNTSYPTLLNNILEGKL